MTKKTDYRLENRQNKEIKLRSQRRDILKNDGQTALTMILDAPSPATLTQSFPDQDLYYLMHKIGPDDFIPVLSMASSDQWEYILDVDVWTNDRLDTDMMTRVFDILYQADSQRLLRWAITQKPDFFEFYLFKNMTVTIREHDEPPPDDFNDYITIDDKFYFRFPGKPDLKQEGDMPVPKDSRQSWELIETMLKALADMDLSVFHGLLLETSGLLPAETEEEQFRLKTLRLAEKGFLPAHEAVGIYQPVKASSMGIRPEKLDADTLSFDPDIPLPPQFFTGFLEDDNLFVKALQLFETTAGLALESELAALINKVISADRIRLRKKENLEKVISKTCNYLNLGLESLLSQSNQGLTDASAKTIIEKRFLEDIFRTGSRAGIQLKTMAHKWFDNSFMSKNNLPLSFLDEHFLGVLGGLLIDRPLFFDPAGKGDLYRDFKTMADILTTRTNLEQIMTIDTIIDAVTHHLDTDMDSFSQGMLTYKTLLLTLWAKDRLQLENDLSPIGLETFKPFFTALFASNHDSPESPGTEASRELPLSDLMLFIVETTGLEQKDLPLKSDIVVKKLISELDEEYGHVTPENIDPRFIPHFLLK